MTTRPTPPPEAELIRRHREDHVPHLSMREAARRAGMSASRWQMIEHGIRRVSGQDFPERGPADAIAAMALAVGVPPPELEAAGRQDAADRLVKLAADRAANDGATRAEAARMVAGVAGLNAKQRARLTEEVATDLRQVRDQG